MCLPTRPLSAPFCPSPSPPPSPPAQRRSQQRADDASRRRETVCAPAGRPPAASHRYARHATPRPDRRRLGGVNPPFNTRTTDTHARQTGPPPSLPTCVAPPPALAQPDTHRQCCPVCEGINMCMRGVSSAPNRYVIFFIFLKKNFLFPFFKNILAWGGDVSCRADDCCGCCVVCAHVRASLAVSRAPTRKNRVFRV